MRAYVRLRLQSGSVCELGHGDLIGRLPSAALHIDDIRISEAHALVSLRGRELKLLALRGRFAINQKPVSEVILAEGQVLLLARDLPVWVERVVLPESVLAIEGEGLPLQVLSGICSLTTHPRPSLSPRYLGDATAWIWSAGEDWRLRVPGEEPRPIVEGDVFTLDGRRFSIRAMPLSRAGQGRTEVQGGVAVPMRIIANYDTVHIHRDGEPVFALTGISARIVSELVACGAPVHWLAVAREIWTGDEPEGALRRKWDINLSRLRKKLKDARIRPDLVRSDRTGNVELLLASGDTAVDRT